MTRMDSKLSHSVLAVALALAATVLACPTGARAEIVDLLPLETFEGAFPPAGWAVTNGAPGYVAWHRSDVSPNYGATQDPPISGLHAYAESYPAFCGYPYDTELITPAFSTENIGAGPVTVSFDYQYWVYSTEALTVDYRIGAGPWVPLESLVSYGGYAVVSHQIDITGTIGYPDVQLRWRYYNAGSGCDWWTNLDNIRVQAYVPSLTQEIPTLGTWGLALLALVLAGFGVMALRRHL
jgi:hypothetical protein